MMIDYERDPAAITRQSFAIIRKETALGAFPPALVPVVTRMIHACGMTDLAEAIAWTGDVAGAASRALRSGAPVLVDSRMTAHGITPSRLPADNPVICALDDPRVAPDAAARGTTRSAAAIDLWRDHLDGAVCAIGNAPTALFRLLELIDAGAPKPAALIAAPPGFVGAVEAKDALVADSRGLPSLVVRGRRGGSAIVAAAVNALGTPHDDAGGG